MVESATVIILPCVRPPGTGMNEMTVFSRVAFTDPFVVEVLEVWRVEKGCEGRGKSRVMVGWRHGTVSDLGVRAM